MSESTPDMQGTKQGSIKQGSIEQTRRRVQRAIDAADAARADLLHRMRKRALAFVVGVGLAAVAMVALTTVPAWPVIGVAVATVAVGISQIASRLEREACAGCGGTLRGVAASTYGVICPSCGTMNQRFAQGGRPEDWQGSTPDDDAEGEGPGPGSPRTA